MCNLKPQVKKYIELKAQIAELEIEAKKISEKIMEKMTEADIKTYEYDDVKVTKIVSMRTTYSDGIIAVLKEKAPVCIRETYDNDKLKACITAGVLSDKDVEPYRSQTPSSYIKVSKAKTKAK